MATIHPPANGVSFNREEAAANTWLSRKLPDPLTNEQLADIRAKAQARPQHNTHSAEHAQAIDERAARRAAKQ